MSKLFDNDFNKLPASKEKEYIHVSEEKITYPVVRVFPTLREQGLDLTWNNNTSKWNIFKESLWLSSHDWLNEVYQDYCLPHV